MILRVLVLLTIVSGMSIGTALAQDPADSDALGTPPSQAATPETVTRWIAALGAPSYAERTRASRALLAIGATARPALAQAAEGDHFEVAQRARHMLNVLDQLYFSGVRVHLRPDRTRIAWNEPVDLIIEMTNHAEAPARIPFQLGNDRTDSQGDLLHLCDMIDAAEWLTVRGPGGEVVDLVVDDLGHDRAIQAELEKRIKGPEPSLLAPGATAQVRLAAFNRNWVRFPLLDRGGYTLSFDYLPAWEDAALRDERAGAVAAEPVRITVDPPAPPEIVRRGPSAAIVLQVVRDDTADRSSTRIVAEFLNRGDTTIYVNANHGNAAPFARTAWHLTLGNVLVELPAVPPEQTFEVSRIHAVAPGERLVLCEKETAEFTRAITEQGHEPTSGWQVRLEYTNPLDRAWQQRESGGAAVPPLPIEQQARQAVLPRGLVCGRLTSPTIDLP